MTATDRTRTPFTVTGVDERHEVYAGLAAGGSVHRIQLPHGEPAWLVTGYDDVRQALADPRLVKGGPPPVEPGQPLPADVHRAMMNDLLHLDPPDHTRLRRLVSSAFTRRRVEDLAPRIGQLADALLDELLAAPREVADLIPAYAFPLPMTVLCELLGVPADDAPAFRGWSTTLVAGSLAPVAEWVGAATSLIGYVRDLLDRKRRQPGDDLLHALVAARDGADRLSEDELTSMVFLLLVAGQETTVNLIANGTLTLLLHPAELAAVRADPAALPAVVEEVLRYDGPVQVATPRIAVAPVELGGVLIAPGDVVVPSLLAANRDPRRPGGDVFDPRRTPALPHTAFGHGVHHCLGAPLARLEGRIALERLVTRCPDLRLATTADRLELRPSMLMHGLASLPVAVSRPA
jgi:cytochrome P450